MEQPAFDFEHKKSKRRNVSVLDAIRSRRSIRAYSSKHVDNDSVALLLDAAHWAPSAMNLQPWCFAVVQNKPLLHRISQEAKEVVLHSPMWSSSLEKKLTPLSDPGFDIFYGAGTLIVICAKTEGFEPTGDAYFAGQNLMLAAYSLGLGTCVVGFARDVLRKEHFKKELSIPEGFTPVLPIIVGYPTEAPHEPKREVPPIVSWIR
ncbi:MAG: nitroreductase family protein [Bdellovibrio sp.]|nr:nitroreductase family protein [Bdellovibrio sp.]